MTLFLHISPRKEFLVTVMLPGVVSLGSGMLLNYLALEHLVPPFFGVRTGLVPRYDLALLCLLFVLTLVATVQWRYGARGRYRVASAAVASLGFISPLSVSLGTLDVAFMHEFEIGSLLFLFAPTFLILLCVVWTTALLRMLVYCEIVLWRPGLCPACGYSLNGNLSGTCPECGTQEKDNKESQTKKAKTTGHY